MYQESRFSLSQSTSPFLYATHLCVIYLKRVNKLFVVEVTESKQKETDSVRERESKTEKERKKNRKRKKYSKDSNKDI